MRRNRLAPTTSTSEIATCTMSSALLSQVRDPTTLRLVSLSAELTLTPVPRSAGAMPKRSPVKQLTPMTKRENLPVERHWLARCSGQKLFSPIADDNPERAAHSGKEKTLGQELAHQPPPRRAERQPHRQFFLPRRRAREQQVGDVRTDDQQDEGNDDAEDGHRAQFVREDVVNAARAGLDEEPRHFRPVAIALRRAFAVGQGLEIRSPARCAPFAGTRSSRLP